MDLREQVANALYGELHDGDEDVHPYDERWYRAADAILALDPIREVLAALSRLDDAESAAEDYRTLGD